MLSQNAQYQGRISLSGNSQSRIPIDGNANLSSRITISNTPSFLVQMQGDLTSKVVFEFVSGTSPIQSQAFVDHTSFVGSVLQDGLRHA